MERKEIAVGGQAVIEGVMMRGPQLLATAIRRKNGQIEVKTDPFITCTQTNSLYKLPIVRGFVSLIEMMKIGFSTLSFSAKRYELDYAEADEKSEARKKTEETFTFVLAILLGFLLFALLPYKGAQWVGLGKSNLWFNLFAGGMRIVFFVVYVYAISLMKDVKRVFEYHGAEHKAVHAYEKSGNLELKNVATYSTLHPRCGTSFMFLVLLTAILVFALTDTLVVYYAKDRLPWLFNAKGVLNTYLRLGYHLLLIPIVSGLSYEILKFSGKNIDHPLVRFFTMPGMTLQKITTQPPDEEQLEVAVVALKCALEIPCEEEHIIRIPNDTP